jgi:hypothetical protein
MADSTSNLAQLLFSQALKEASVNALVDALSPSSFFGRNSVTSAGLVWGFYGGKVIINGALTTIANATITLTASTTNFVERTASGVVSVNTTAFTPGRVPLYQVVTGASTVTSWTDWRIAPRLTGTGSIAIAMSNSNQTLTRVQADCRIITLTGALTAVRDLVIPQVSGDETREYVIVAGTTGGFGVNVKGATGSSVLVPDGRRAIVQSDGVNCVCVNDFLNSGLTIQGGQSTQANPLASGAYIYQNSGFLSYGAVDATRSANNRIHEFLMGGAGFTGRFINDAYTLATNWLEVSGGYAAGITNIRFNGPVGINGKNGISATAAAATATDLATVITLANSLRQRAIDFGWHT